MTYETLVLFCSEHLWENCSLGSECLYQHTTLIPLVISTIQHMDTLTVVPFVECLNEFVCDLQIAFFEIVECHRLASTENMFD